MKKSSDSKKNKVLISVSVLGSTGPLRMLVDGDDSTSRIIDKALKLYVREGRLPVLGSDHDQYFLYCHDSAGAHTVLAACEAIGSTGVRSFLMAPKRSLSNAHRAATETGRSCAAAAASFKSWINKSLTVKITRWHG